MSKQSPATYEIDYLADGTEKVIDLSTINTPTYSNVTVPNGGSLISSGSGITYSVGTGTAISSPWGPTGTSASGTVSAKDFLIDGELSLREVLEQRLNCLVPNPELEAEWNELKELGDRYRALEKDLQEKAKMWKALKKT